MYVLHIISKPASQDENTAEPTPLFISNPSVLKIFKLVVLLHSYERFYTGKVNANGH